MTDIAPAPSFPERPSTTYERALGVTNPARRGPSRFQEGVCSDSDVPSEFSLGYSQGVLTPPGHPNANCNVFEKSPEETMKERAHVGSASWIEAPVMLGEFADGAFADYATVEFQEKIVSGARQSRPNCAAVND
jgi:hypothetical protein